MIDTRPAALPVFVRVGELRSRIAERFARYRTYRTTLNELNALSDRELEDLGICRADIHFIARDSALGN